MKDARLLTVLADLITQPFPATNPETLFSRFTPPTNKIRENCCSCHDAPVFDDDVLCDECARGR